MPYKMNDSEKVLAHAIIRWYRAQAAPRHVQVACEQRLAEIAERLLRSE